MRTNNYLLRIRLLSLCIFVFSVILIGRLYTLQIVQGDEYEERADRQYTSLSKKIFDRGSIYFQNKDGSLVSGATLKYGYIIAINPQNIKEPEQVWQKLNEIIPVDKELFLVKANKKNDPYEEIETRVSQEIADKISELKISGLSVYKERWRVYPGGQMASHVLGIMGYKGDEYAGRYGLERSFEGNLKRDGSLYSNFFSQIFTNIKRATNNSAELEADIITTIEPTVQLYLESIIASTTSKWNADLIGSIVMNPMTGEIYAIASSPAFDPNNLSQALNSSVFSNPLIENVYEMGSIVKVLTMASGIDANVVNAKTTYYDKGFIIIDGKKISNFDSKERGVVNMQDVLSQSLNVGSAYVQSLLGGERFVEYMKAFGLWNKTGIELPNEAKNIVSSLESGVRVDLASASFGQSIALSPISTISAISIVANGGVTIKPHIVKSIKYKIGPTKNTEISLGNRVIKRETSEEMSRMMVYSVDNVLMNGSLKQERHSIAVKTGTAQIARSGGGGYYEDRILHSFVGFFPAYNPKFISLFFMVNPKGARYGSETLTLPFMDLAKFLINYYEIPPDR